MSASKKKTYILKLYVAGNTPNSMRALQTLREILENEFRGVYALKVIDVLENPVLKRLIDNFYKKNRSTSLSDRFEEIENEIKKTRTNRKKDRTT